MSLQKSVARAKWGTARPGMGSMRTIPRGLPAGDPGIFGDIWGGIKGAVGGFVSGGPIGAISGAVTGFTGPSQTSPIPAPPLPPMRTLQETVAMNGGRPPTVGEKIQRFLPGGATGYEAQSEEARRAGKRSSEGYHWNKAGYWLKGGEYVHPGTRQVKNRRMNPLNPHAVKLSMRRLGRAKSAATDLNRVTIRAKKCKVCK